MNDISDILRELLDRYSNTPALDEEFERMLREDDTLRADYSEWCDENGYKASTGYREFVNELVESQDSIWENFQMEES